MSRREFDGRLATRVELEICLDCHSIWFDALESTRLTPGAIIELFRLIHDERNRPFRPLGDAMRCPACRGTLQFTHDIERSGPVTYYRCVAGHGRLTTYMQFLREKSFVRSPSKEELDRLRSLVRQVRCSSCGGPVDLVRDAACPYCHAPIAILDPDAVRDTLAQLQQDERRRVTPDPHAAGDALIAAARAASLAERERPATAFDLVADALAPFFIGHST
jgi:hypothetical protein